MLVKLTFANGKTRLSFDKNLSKNIIQVHDNVQSFSSRKHFSGYILYIPQRSSVLEYLFYAPQTVAYRVTSSPVYNQTHQKEVRILEQVLVHT